LNPDIIKQLSQVSFYVELVNVIPIVMSTLGTLIILITSSIVLYKSLTKVSASSLLISFRKLKNNSILKTEEKIGTNAKRTKRI